jgi:uncharacterized C2H2 Zn-finger protein
VTTSDEELTILENKVKQLKLEYEQYFSGTRPREPQILRNEVQKTIIRHMNETIRNTAHRFRFNSINQRFQAFKRQWDAILRQIDAGTYKRHVFKADLHDRERGVGVGPEKPTPAGGGSASTGDLFEAYRDARMACGQSVSGLTEKKLQAVIAKQEAAVRQKLGCEKVNFRVVVESGKVKLKASAG